MPHYTTTPDFPTLFFHNLEPQRHTFSPKFDVYETTSSYTLEGDLPGLKKQNLSIEFTDPVTLVIKGHISKKSSITTSETPKSETPKGGSRTSSPKRKEKEFKTRQWVSERTVGAFQRSFTFPAGIEQEGVTAALEHGVLRIVVPKMAPVSRRIEIS
ncbi:HSP20-like chaperone [Morchella conica CCBAS932]|uniref:HSP20-like chaperone n=1 Tax=Morchella conica CCBAS932 TaxID=1392247 RepID=A0A3N4KDQ0_9PEZI|nr:HSP20-like chaperone [Morchella conica CCBAS932]